MSTKLVGECDGCPRTDVELFPVDKMNLCASCRDKELEAIAALREERQLSKNNTPAQVIQHARSIDSSMKVSADVFNAETISFVTLRSAIDNDESIPADQKNNRFMQEIQARIEQLDSVIFPAEKELLNLKNQRHAWITQRQQFIGKLREDERAKYKQYDVAYQPTTKAAVKKVLTSKPARPRKAAFSMSKLTEACKKYDLPRDAVRSIMLSKNMSEEDAALHLAKLMGKAS